MLRVREYLGTTQKGTTQYSPAVNALCRVADGDDGSSATVAGSDLDFQVVDQPVVPAEVFQTDNISIQIVPGGLPPARAPARPTLSTSSLKPVLGRIRRVGCDDRLQLLQGGKGFKLGSTTCVGGSCEASR